jgi:hypothetical protein
LVCLLTACSVPPPPGAPSIAAIVPSSGQTTEDTAVRIQGAGFHLGLSTDLDHDTIDIEAATASIGTTPLANLVWRGEDLVEATVPAGLPLGTYDVTLAFGTRAATLPDGFTVTPEALPTTPFGAPVLITALSSPGTDDDPSITADRLELFFNSDRTGGLGGTDIWVTTRSSTSEPWPMPVLVPEVSSTSSETTPKISADGLTLFFASDRPGGMSLSNDVWVSTRATRSDPWSTPMPVTELNAIGSDTGANPNVSLTTLVMSSDRGGTSDIYIATRASTTVPWNTPQQIAEISSPDGEADPCIAHQDRVVLFVSSRLPTLGYNDLYIATRPSASAPFDPPVVITELSTAGNEEDPWISDDLRYILFTSSVSGDFEIYEASR